MPNSYCTTVWYILLAYRFEILYFSNINWYINWYSKHLKTA